MGLLQGGLSHREACAQKCRDNLKSFQLSTWHLLQVLLGDWRVFHQIIGTIGDQLVQASLTAVDTLARTQAASDALNELHVTKRS
jgi:hypothetical protein